MQIVSVPLFNRNMLVEAYRFRYREGNELFSTTQTLNIFDGASRSAVLQTLNHVGLDAFTLGKPIFVPIKSTMLLNDLGAQCGQPPEKVVFLLENLPNSGLSDEYMLKIAELSSIGYRFAVSDISELNRCSALLKQCSFFFLSHSPGRLAQSSRILGELRSNYRNITVAATEVRDSEIMENLHSMGYVLFESRFLKLSDTSKTDIAPLKMNSIRLLNTVQDNNFEFEEVARIVQGDPALAISLLRMVNARAYGSRNKIKSIQQAVAMLGQQEVRKWVITAVTQSLGDDRPNEIIKVSLVRAKFAENLAPLFELAHMTQGLFLMGLFSVLDVILEVPMTKALEMVSVADMIRSALASQSGIYYPILNMLVSYETADWVTVSRLMIVHEIQMEDLSNAYIEAMLWYKDVVTFESGAPENDAATNSETQ